LFVCDASAAMAKLFTKFMQVQVMHLCG